MHVAAAPEITIDQPSHQHVIESDQIVSEQAVFGGGSDISQTEFTHIHDDGREVTADFEQARKLCPVLGAMSVENAKFVMQHQDALATMMAKGAAIRAAREEPKTPEIRPTVIENIQTSVDRPKVVLVEAPVEALSLTPAIYIGEDEAILRNLHEHAHDEPDVPVVEAVQATEPNNTREVSEADTLHKDIPESRDVVDRQAASKTSSEDRAASDVTRPQSAILVEERPATAADIAEQITDKVSMSNYKEAEPEQVILDHSEDKIAKNRSTIEVTLPNADSKADDELLLEVIGLSEDDMTYEAPSLDEIHHAGQPVAIEESVEQKIDGPLQVQVTLIAERLQAVLEEAEPTRVAVVDALVTQITALLEPKDVEESLSSKHDAELDHVLTKLCEELEITVTEELLREICRVIQTDVVLKQTIETMHAELVPKEAGTREFLQRMQAAVHRLQRALAHSYAIGQSVMRVYAAA